MREDLLTQSGRLLGLVQLLTTTTGTLPEAVR